MEPLTLAGDTSLHSPVDLLTMEKDILPFWMTRTKLSRFFIGNMRFNEQKYRPLTIGFDMSFCFY